MRGFPVEPETIATAIRIGNPANWEKALKARDESHGVIDMVSDREILYAQSLIGLEGIFCEPASAASVAGILKMKEKGLFKGGEKVVATLTGNGLKDPHVIEKEYENKIKVIPAKFEDFEREIES
ncbi:threonine synthase [Athalassotoga saccharophila]|nr:threonine synthase [Athalassotoga saccharophila]